MHDSVLIASKNIELDISFWDKNHRSYVDGHLAHVFLVKGIIYYDISEPNKPLGKSRKSVHEERYEDALRIVKQMNNPVSNEVEGHSGIIQNNNFPFSNSDVRVDDSQETTPDDFSQEKEGPKGQGRKGPQGP